MNKKMRKNIMSIIIIAIGVIISIQLGILIYKISSIQTNVIDSQIISYLQEQQQMNEKDTNNEGSFEEDLLNTFPTVLTPIETVNSPYYGNRNADVTFVEFTDYECPFCSNVQDTIEKLKEKYDNKVRFVVRNYPLASIHPGAVDAALAGLCANEQDKFWELHKAMFEKANVNGSLNKELLKTLASDLGLDQQIFDQCLDAHKYIEQVQKDYEDGTTYGVSGTPTFFINNRMITGAQSLEIFEKIIEDELNIIK